MLNDRGNNALATAVGVAMMAIGIAADAQAQGLKVELSGQVNRAFMAADDGVDSETFFVDNINSGSRFRIIASGDVNPGLKVGVLYEMEFGGNESHRVSMPGTSPGREVSPELRERHAAVYLQGGWGKVMLGQTDGAANGGVEVDLSGTQVAHYAFGSLIGGGIMFRDSAGGFGPTILSTNNAQDFESRYDVVRYDTPVFGGFHLSGSFGNKADSDVREVALRYSGNLGAIGRLAGALGLSSKDVATGGNDETIGGSISWLHGSGVNVTLGLTNRVLDGAVTGDKKFRYTKVGYKAGKHAVSVDFGRAENQLAAGDTSDFYGIGYVYTPAAWLELYAALKQHTLDRSGR